MSKTQTTSTSTTTRSRMGDTTRSKTSSTTSSKDVSFTGRALGLLGRAEMIGITIITLSLGSVAFSPLGEVQSLQAQMPNYNQTNTYIPHENPETITFNQYGEDVVSTLDGWIKTFGAIGAYSRDYWTAIQNLFTPQIVYGGFSQTFGEARFDELASYRSYIISVPSTINNGNDRVFVNLTQLEKNWIVANVNSSTLSDGEKNLFYSTIFWLLKTDIYGVYGGIKFFFTEPSVYTNIINNP